MTRTWNVNVEVAAQHRRLQRPHNTVTRNSAQLSPTPGVNGMGDHVQDLDDRETP